MAIEKPDTLHGRILEEFSRKIVDGTWPPGFSLPKETELADQYGVSRMTMNKVLTRLASDGFVIRRKRSGTVVAQPRAESAVLAINNIGEEVAALGRRYKWALLSSERRASNAQDQRILNLQEDEGQDNCLFLDSLNQARRFHNLMLNAFLRKNHDAQSGNGHELPITIIGAGATGVELAAELRLASRELPIYGMNHLRPEDVSITVVEAADRILPALPARLSEAATRELDHQNVRVMTGEPVSEVRDGVVVLKDGTEIASEMTIWAAGIKAPAFLATLDGLETNRGNQIKVKQTLEATTVPDIFAFGDCAECPQPQSERPVPPRAQSAHQQADTLFKTLCHRLEGREAVPFVYNDHGSLINFSRYTTVGNLMGNLSGRSMYIEGKVARLFYLSLYRMHQVALHGVVRTGIIWLMDRISRAMHPRLKLH